ncbi:MAG: 2,3-diphosphoglycerate-dependent phosphoglycerate mutase [Minisyncoccia bacterium]
MAYTLVLMRHGESVWNQLDKFTGWTDVELSAKGIQEAKVAGIALLQNNLEFDLAYTSVLNRAIDTLHHVLEEGHMTWIPVIKDWHLNERHYGALQGKNKTESIDEFGEYQVKVWRRAFAIKPPLLSEYDSRYPANDERYRDVPLQDLPIGESLKDTLDRVYPYWESELKPAILSGKRLIIAAHGNSLRALVKFLENISDNKIIDTEIPTGNPLVYQLDEKTLKVLKKYYLVKKPSNNIFDQIKSALKLK